MTATYLRIATALCAIGVIIIAEMFWVLG